MTSKYRRKGRSKFIMIENYVVRSEAWRALTANDKAVYLHLKWIYDGVNNGRLAVGCREAAQAIGVASKNTGSISLKNLEAKGFIAKAKPSSFHVKSRTSTEWRLTEYACNVTGELPTKEFTRWRQEKTTVLPQGRTVLPQIQIGSGRRVKHG